MKWLMMTTFDAILNCAKILVMSDGKWWKDKKVERENRLLEFSIFFLLRNN